MKHTWMQKKQTNFLRYGQKVNLKGGSIMSKESQLARFYQIYDKMSIEDRECIELGMIYKLGSRVGLVFVFGITLGIIIGQLMR